MKKKKNNNKRQGKPFDPEEERRSQSYEYMLPLASYQRDYFTGYNYHYWLHKGAALQSFIEDKSKLSTLRFDKDVDIDTDDHIIENLKMEIHMMVFHSAESLFLTVLGHYFYPAVPWFWMPTCTQKNFKRIMNLWQEKGLDAIIKEPEKWLRDILYPTITESHEKYQKTKDSATFAKKYLNRLVHEHMKYGEYNAYKHGLRVFPGQGRIQAIDNVTKQVVFDTRGDILEFLTHEKPADQDYKYRINSNTKRYDVRVDFNIISITTGLLQNLLERKRVELKTPSGQKAKFYYVYFDGLKIEDIFGFGYYEMRV